MLERVGFENSTASSDSLDLQRDLVNEPYGLCTRPGSDDQARLRVPGDERGDVARRDLDVENAPVAQLVGSCRCTQACSASALRKPRRSFWIAARAASRERGRALSEGKRSGQARTWDRSRGLARLALGSGCSQGAHVSLQQCESDFVTNGFSPISSRSCERAAASRIWSPQTRSKCFARRAAPLRSPRSSSCSTGGWQLIRRGTRKSSSERGRRLLSLESRLSDMHIAAGRSSCAQDGESRGCAFRGPAFWTRSQHVLSP